MTETEFKRYLERKLIRAYQQNTNNLKVWRMMMGNKSSIEPVEFKLLLSLYRQSIEDLAITHIYNENFGEQWSREIEENMRREIDGITGVLEKMLELGTKVE